MTLTTRPSGAGPQHGLLVPVLFSQDGPADAVAVSAWHLALSNLIGQEVPHDLLALWLFPERGGAVLLAPEELGRDRVAVAPPDPFVSQHQLFELEERIRSAGYRSVVAVPIRHAARDLGLALFAHLQPGRYGAEQALQLHALMRHVVPTFAGLAAAPPLALAAGPAVEVTPQNVAECVARAAAEGRNGPEVLRLVSGVVQALVPHERVDVAVPGLMPSAWALLSGAPDGRRWGESTSDVSQTVTGLVARASGDGTILVGDLRALGLTWPAYRDTRALHRVHAVLGVRLSVSGADDAWLLLGGAAPDLYREADREVLHAVAPVLALRVHGLRAALEAEVARAQAASLQAGHSRAARLAAALAGTAHWGDAVGFFVQDVRESLGYHEVRFALRLGAGTYVDVPAGDLRPLASLPGRMIVGSPLEPVFAGGAPFLVQGERGADLAVPLRVAGRVVGVLELMGGAPGSAGHPVTAAQLFADLMAPHLELVRRGALGARVEVRA